MKAAILLNLVAGLALVVAGCASYRQEPATASALGREQEQVAELINSFAQAVRNKDAEAAMRLVAPDLPELERKRLEGMVRQAVWMELYTGYDVRFKAPSRRGLRAGRLSLTVLATNASGDSFKDKCVIARSAGKWYIVGLSLQEPVRGEALDPPPAVAEQIRGVLTMVLLSLKERKPGGIIAALPEDSASRFRAGNRTFWQRLWSEQPGLYPIYADLQALEGLEVQRWPDPAAKMPLALVTPAVVAACYDIPYLWPPSGGLENLRLEVLLTRKQANWALQAIRLYGKGIPESE